MSGKLKITSVSEYLSLVEIAHRANFRQRKTRVNHHAHFNPCRSYKYNWSLFCLYFNISGKRFPPANPTNNPEFQADSAFGLIILYKHMRSRIMVAKPLVTSVNLTDRNSVLILNGAVSDFPVVVDTGRR